MKILFISSFYPPHVGGGAELILACIASGLASRGFSVSVLATKDGAGISRKQVDGVNVIRVPLSNLYWHLERDNRPSLMHGLWHAIDSYNPAMGRAVSRVIADVGPDVVCSHNLSGFSCAAWAAAADAGIPVVQVLHDYYSICPRVNMHRNGQNCEKQCRVCSMFRLPHRRASRSIAAVVAVSRWVLDTHLREGLFGGVTKKSVIYNARTLPVKYESMARAPGTLTFGFIGTLSEVKGISLLLEAFVQVTSTSGRKIRLLVAGTGEEQYVHSLRRAYESDTIQFLGRTDPAVFFPQLDVSVVPSLWQEPLAGVVYESMHFGIPVIGARRGGTPEMIQDGVNGLLFEPRSPGELAAAMLSLANDPGKLARLSSAAPHSVATFLDEERMLDEHEALIRDVALSVTSASASH